MNRFFSILTLCVVVWTVTRAEESAVVNDNKINVRGQPSFVGEVVTQLQRGDAVTVLERIQVENPKPGEPAAWARIKLPANTPVWAFAPFIKEGSVAVSRLNVRAGPGENYSVLGRMERGTRVTEIRTVEEWMEIEAPTNAYAFVDASLLKGGESAVPAAAAAVATATPAAAEPVTAANPPPTVAATTTEPLREETLPPPQPQPTQDALAPATTAPAQPEPLPTETVIQTSPVVAATPTTTEAPAAQPLPQVAEPVPPTDNLSPKRVVRREGIVRSTRSIQAPTWFELEHPETKRTINYLHEERLGIKLNEFKGLRVVVSGEEAIDPRWPRTPILELESIEAAP